MFNENHILEAVSIQLNNISMAAFATDFAIIDLRAIASGFIRGQTKLCLIILTTFGDQNGLSYRGTSESGSVFYGLNDTKHCQYTSA